MRPKNTKYAVTYLKNYVNTVKKYSIYVKKMPPFYSRNRIFQQNFFIVIYLIIHKSSLVYIEQQMKPQ